MIVATLAQDSDASCRTINPFIAELPDDVILARPTSFQNKSVCNGLWSTNRTCCDYARATFWVTSIESDEKLAIEKIKSDIAKLSSYSSQLIKQQGSLQKNSVFKILANSDNPIFLNQFAFNIDKCQAFMKKARSAAVCSTCAYPSIHFFLQDRAAVSPSDCFNLIKECSASFATVSSYIKAFFKLSELRSKKLGSDVSKIVAKARWFRVTFKSIYDSGVLSILSENRDRRLANILRVEEPSNLKTMYDICNHMFNLVKPTFFHQTREMFKSLADFPEVRRYPKDHESGNSRKLNFGSHDGSIELDSTDYNYQILSGADTKVQEEQHSDSNTNQIKNGLIRPMNLSLTFP
jgi:hypothetical protein